MSSPPQGFGGQAAPIPLTAQRREVGNVLDYGEFYRGGFVTYGSRGAAYFGGARNEAGQRLPLLFERAGARTSLVEKEVKVIFEELTGDVRVSFQNHPVVQAAEAQRQEPAPAAQAQDQVPAVQEADGLDIPWWAWAAGGTAVTGAAAYAAHRVFASGKKDELPVGPPTKPPVEAGLESRVDQTLRTLAEISRGPGVLVLQMDAIDGRAGLLEFVSRIPPDLSRRVVLFAPHGAGLEGEEIKKRNPKITITERWTQLAEHLLTLPSADVIAFIGDKIFVQRLGEILPKSMQIFSLDSRVSLMDILQYLGIPDSIMDILRISGLEEDLAVLWSA